MTVCEEHRHRQIASMTVYFTHRHRRCAKDPSPGEPGQTHGIAYRYISIKQPIHMDNHIVQCTFVQCVMTGKKAAGA
jgi:hypothetical protein